MINKSHVHTLKLLAIACCAGITASCSEPTETTMTATETAPMESTTMAVAEAEPKLGIRPRGDTELEIDMSQIHNPELVEIFDYIDENIDDHVINLQK